MENPLKSNPQMSFLTTYLRTQVGLLEEATCATQVGLLEEAAGSNPKINALRLLKPTIYINSAKFTNL